ncbi:MAG TPA: DUF6152 family protein [Gammaproteobacteria bacterium]
MSLRALAVLAAALLPILPAAAHHSFAALFDGEKQVTVTGTVTEVEWTNPHIHFTMDVQGEDGAVTHWRFEGYPPNMLVRQGWKRNETLKPGDKVTVFGWGARADPHFGMARFVTLGDGTQMTAGPPAGTGGRGDYRAAGGSEE